MEFPPSATRTPHNRVPSLDQRITLDCLLVVQLHHFVTDKCHVNATSLSKGFLGDGLPH